MYSKTVTNYSTTVVKLFHTAVMHIISVNHLMTAQIYLVTF